MTPAAPLRRYAAWSLDAALLSLLAAIACAGPIAAGIARADAALTALSATMAAWMLESLRDGLSLPALLHAALADPAWRDDVAALAAAITATLWPPLLAFAALALPYHAMFESSRWQATPGKHLLGIRVVGRDGMRIALPRAAWRQLAGALSWLTLNIGHLMAATPPTHRALHDRVAGTQVVQADDAGRLPRWARVWLVAQAVLSLVAMAWLLQTTNAALEAAFARLLPY